MQSSSLPLSKPFTNTTGLLLPAFLAFVLLSILFSIPQPAILVNQPIRVELLLSLFLIALLVSLRGSLQTCSSRLTAAIGFSMGGLVLWSAISAVWGSSFGSVAHHTLLWSVYLAFFLLLTTSERRNFNTRFITTTFVLVSLVLGFLCILDYTSIADFASSEGDLRIRYGKYAELLATISPVVFAVAIYTRDRKRVLIMSVAAVLSWVTVMLSLSKGAFIAGVCGFAVFFFTSLLFSKRLFRKRVLCFAALWLAITIGTQVFFSWFSTVPSTTSYITGAADTTRSTTAMRVFTWKIARQMALDHWLLGVGADNFGLEFNASRERFRETHPNDSTEEIAEDYQVERAHNESLQILSELGIVGALLTAIPFLVFGWYVLNALRGKVSFSPMACAAIAGMIAFVVSSQFSSFSFRSAQNGVAFFMVFALSVNEITKRSEHGITQRRSTISRALFAYCVVTASILMIFCGVKAYAEYHVYAAERSTDYPTARRHFESAIAADPGYAGAYILHAGRSAVENDHSGAVQLTRKAIDNGLASTPIYSRLAKQQIAAGDISGAEATYREAVSIYPRSTFIRTEFRIFLEDQQKPEAAAEQAAIAQSIDLRQANGWYLIMREGSVAAFYRSKFDTDLAPPADLLPRAAVLPYLDKVPGM